MPPRRMRRRATKRKSTRRRRTGKSMASQNFARCSDMMTFTNRERSVPVSTDTAENYSFNLSQFPRAVGIASQYQEYKIDKVEVRFKPYFDTYNAMTSPTPVGTLTRAPQLYKYVLKTGELAPASADWFRALGVNPQTLSTDKNVKFSYKPAIVLSATTAGTATAQIKNSPWLPTNDSTTVGFTPNQIVHYGFCMYIDSQQLATLNTEVGQIEIEAHFVYRKPNAQITSPNTDPVRLNGDIINA